MVFGKKRSKSQEDVTIADDRGHEELQPVTVEPTADVSTETLSSEGKDEAAKGVAEAAAELKRNVDLEARYAHVVAGSVRYVPKGEEVDGTVSKGKMATVQCVDCGATREVNAQDLFQVKHCRRCTETYLKRRQQERRADKKAKKADDVPPSDTPASAE